MSGMSMLEHQNAGIMLLCSSHLTTFHYLYSGVGGEMGDFQGEWGKGLFNCCPRYHQYDGRLLHWANGLLPETRQMEETERKN